jgi:pimeloyl-ACP methyl ester carboxylesterase
MNMRLRSVTTHDGLRLNVVEWGPADGVPIVMLHGIRGYLQTFERIAAALPLGWRTILDSFHLLGHSMGGINAIVYAGAHPQRVSSLVVEDAGPGAFEHSPGAQRIRRELQDTPAGFDDWAAAAAFMRALRPSVTEQARAQRLHAMLKPRGDGGFTWRYDHAGIAATRLAPDPARIVDLMDHVSAIACPTLVLRGGRSDYLQPDMAQAMCDANPRLRWTEIADAGHYIHDDQPQAFHGVLCDFLGRVEPRLAATRADDRPLRPA